MSKGVQKLTREQAIAEREFERLRCYLQRQRWSADDAAWILAGIDPEDTMGGPGNWGFAWLPGGLGPQWTMQQCRADTFGLEKHFELELKDVHGFVSGDSRRPADWIRHALTLDYEPRWLILAKNDPECAKYLADFNRPSSGMAASGGRAKAQTSEQGKAKYEVVRAWDEWKLGKSKDITNTTEFIKVMESKYLDPEARQDASVFVKSGRTIKDWVADLKKTPPLTWVEEIRARIASGT